MSALAMDLHEYIKVRATVENIGYGLTPEIFDALLGGGVSQFFGVLVQGGQLVGDEQEPWPGFLEAWKNSNSGS